jgi:hypothetical protein
MRTLVLTLSLLAACGRDDDGDGVRRRDCDDANAAVFPGAAETCNGVDDDCDGWVDEEVSTVAYWDRDGDGFGDEDMARRVCALPADGTTEIGDCDDLDSTAFPGGSEVCDGRDDDCDGNVDEDVQTAFYVDDDGDGHGTSDGVTADGCIPPDGYAALSDDCDDGEPRAWTGAEETCDEADNDCDGSVDEDLPPTRVYADADGDGHGDPAAPGLACGGVTGWSLDSADCDDGDASIGPQAEEIASNASDEDCDGWTDEIAVPDHFATIDEALAAASAGDVVQVGPGTWTGTWDLGLGLTFVGEGCGTTVLYGDGAGPVLSTAGGTIGDLTVAGGDSAGAGGGLVVIGDATVSGACFDGNTAMQGGGIALLGGHLAVSDSRFVHDHAYDHGGAIWAAAGTTLEVRRGVFLDDTADGDYGVDWRGGGGAIYSEGAVDVASSAFSDCRSGYYGGAIFVRTDATPATLTVRNATFDDSYAWSSLGQAVYVRGATAKVTNVLLSHHERPDASALYMDAGGSLETSYLAVFDGAGQDVQGKYRFEALRADPVYYDRDPGAAIEGWDLRLSLGSELIDAGDPALLDPDGTRSDIGAFGGPDAPADFAWAYADDADSDGMPDGWEVAAGTNPWVDDSAGDPDADGVLTGEELALGAAPLVADSDADAVPDGEEVALGSDPADPRDQLPLADAGRDRWALAGEPVGLDATASYDPNGDALGFAWTLLEAPAGSAVTGVDAPGGPDPELLPDVAGTYRLRVEVTDGRATVEDEVLVVAADAVVVPDDAATVTEAVALGGVVAVRAGTWPTNLDLAADVVIFGLDAREEVVLDGGGLGPVVLAGSGQSVTLASLTVTGGLGADGGGVSAIGGGTVALQDVVLAANRASGNGGGVFADYGDVVIADSLVTFNSATNGGGLYVNDTDRSDSSYSGHLTMVRTVVAYDTATVYGGGLYVDDEAAVSASVLLGNEAPEGAALYVYDDAAIVNVVLADNGGAGGATYGYAGDLTLRNTIAAFNRTAFVHQRRSSGPETWAFFQAFHGNSGDVFAQAADDVGANMGAVYADPGFTAWSDDGDPSDDVWALRPGSALADVGQPEMVDLDGSRSDIGAWGGPDSWRGSWRFLSDRDGDGMSDGWEGLYGLDPGADDALADADADGLSNADEWGIGLDPTDADTDHDGFADGAEIASGDDPLDGSAHRPTADAGADTDGQVGTPVSLDGLASSDPDGDALSWSWTLAGRPAGSSLTDADITGADTATPSFVPDVHGAWRLALVVSDGWQSSDPDEVEVAAWDELRVPEDYPTIDDALAVLEPGDHVVLGAGTFVAAVDGGELDWTLEGQGSEITTLEGPGDASVVTAERQTSTGLRPTVTVRGLTITGGLGNDGGGVDCEYADLVLEDVVLRDNVGYLGGGISLDQCTATLTDVDVLENNSAGGGGGVYQSQGTLTWTGGEVSRNETPDDAGALYLSSATTTLSNLAFVANDGYAAGAAIYQSGGTLTGRNLTVVGTGGRYGAVYVTGTADIQDSVFAWNEGYGLFRGSITARVTTQTNAYWQNTSGSTYPSSLFGASDRLADPGFVWWDAEDPASTDVRLAAASAIRDVNASRLDPDGTSGDLGAWGGPDAGDGWDEWLRDTDGDGAADGWESAFGLDPASSGDGASDGDGDGLDAATEHDLGTDPTLADSDADGVDDDVEDAAGDDPADDSDHRPVANGGIDRTGVIGSATALSASASSDPDGSALTYAWTLVAKPGRSALGSDLGTSATASLSPDTPGAYVVELVVSDGTAWSEPDTITVTVAGDLTVPGDYATVGEALAAVASGSEIVVDAGTWPLSADLGGKSVTITGAGSGLTVLDGEGEAILTGMADEDVALVGLTLANGRSGRGAAVRSTGDVSLDDVVFEGNRAPYGGGLYVEDGTLLATDVAAVENLATRHGGAFYVKQSASDLVRTESYGNVALDAGGTMYFMEADLVLTNAIFVGNEAKSGGGIYFYTSASADARATMSHVTAAYNTAGSGGFLFDYAAVITLTNSILGWNDPYQVHGQNTGTRGAAFTATYTLAYGGAYGEYSMTSTSGTIPTPGTDGNLEEDPLFAGGSDDEDWTNDDLTLATGSPAIDAGSGSDPDGSAADLGAWGGAESF